ncbi:MAG: glucose 1-dehydrogenase [Streptosporangiales bacterium]|nr:glucose 1-dehydrogenase [Streptosporangiales bacterium]
MTMTSATTSSAAARTPAPLAGDLRSRFDLTGRTAIVTGGASGLGRMSAWGLASYGADVVVGDLAEADAAGVAAAIAADTGSRCVGVRVDVTNAEQVESFIARAVDSFGTVDVCVNSAGINHRAHALDLSVAAFRRVLEVNLVGTLLCAQAAGRVMIGQRSGKVINMASVLGHVGMPRQAAYAASKGAVVQLTKVLALEWAPHGVQVNALAPAHVSTPLTDQLPADLRADALARIPQRRFADADEIAAPIVFLASRASDFLTGASVPFDGGWSAA